MPNGSNVHAEVPQRSERLFHFGVVFSQTNHEATFDGGRFGVGHVLEHALGGLPIRLGPHLFVKPRNRLDVVVKNIGFRCQHHVEGARVPFEVRGQDFNLHVRVGSFDGGDASGKMRCAVVGQFIAVHAGDDNVL